MRWLALSFVALGLTLGVIVLGACQEQDRARADLIRTQAEATRIANARQVELNRLEIERKATAQVSYVQLDAAVSGAATSAAKAVGIISFLLIPALSVAVGLYVVRLSWAQAEHAQAQARILTIPVEKATLQPAPYVVVGQFVIDTATKERFNLGDPRDVHKLALAAAAQSRNIALGMRAAERIGNATRDARPAESLPGIAANVPLLEEREE